MVGISMACLFLCLHRYHEVGWSGYVMMSMALAWVWVLLPLLFPRFRPMIFLPVDFACLAAFLLYNHYPAKIFMGDTGSMALGGVLSAMAIVGHME